MNSIISDNQSLQNAMLHFKQSVIPPSHHHFRPHLSFVYTIPRHRRINPCYPLSASTVMCTRLLLDFTVSQIFLFVPSTPLLLHSNYLQAFHRSNKSYLIWCVSIGTSPHLLFEYFWAVSWKKSNDEKRNWPQLITSFAKCLLLLVSPQFTFRHRQFFSIPL